MKNMFRNTFLPLLTTLFCLFSQEGMSDEDFITDIPQVGIGDDQAFAAYPGNYSGLEYGQDSSFSSNSVNLKLGYTSARGIGRTPGYATLAAYSTPHVERGCYAPYFDVRGHYLDNGRWAANVGLGVQFAPAEGGALWRIYGFYDWLEGHGRGNHSFDQGSAGFERIGEEWDFRANVYIPLKYKGYHDHKRVFRFNGDFFATRREHVTPMTGYDFEVSRCVNLGDWLNFYASVGPYYYKGPHHGQAVGGKIRLESEVYNGVIVGVQGSYDNKFKGAVLGEISWIFPFGNLGNSGCDCAPVCLPVHRQDIIVIERHCRWRTNY